MLHQFDYEVLPDRLNENIDKVLREHQDPEDFELDGPRREVKKDKGQAKNQQSLEKNEQQLTNRQGIHYTLPKTIILVFLELLKIVLKVNTVRFGQMCGKFS